MAYKQLIIVNGYHIPWFQMHQVFIIWCMAKPSPSHAKDPDLVAIGQKIRELRTSAGLSQEQLANEAGVDRSYMGGIERGEHNLSIINLLKISRCLQVKLSLLFSIADL